MRLSMAWPTCLASPLWSSFSSIKHHPARTRIAISLPAFQLITSCHVRPNTVQYSRPYHCIDASVFSSFARYRIQHSISVSPLYISVVRSGFHSRHTALVASMHVPFSFRTGLVKLRYLYHDHKYPYVLIQITPPHSKRDQALAKYLSMTAFLIFSFGAFFPVHSSN